MDTCYSGLGISSARLTEYKAFGEGTVQNVCSLLCLCVKAVEFKRGNASASLRLMFGFGFGFGFGFAATSICTIWL